MIEHKLTDEQRKYIQMVYTRRKKRIVPPSMIKILEDVLQRGSYSDVIQEFLNERRQEDTENTPYETHWIVPFELDNNKYTSTINGRNCTFQDELIRSVIERLSRTGEKYPLPPGYDIRENPSGTFKIVRKKL